MRERGEYEGGIRWSVRGAHLRPFEDIFHRLMQAHWGVVILYSGVAYLLSALAFAVAFFALDGSIRGSDGSFATAYWFSIQTLSTIGYGTLSPSGPAANVLVTAESFVGLSGVAIVTAVMYAKFALPSARVVFSDSVVFHERDGKKVLMIRLANERTTPILSVNLHLAVLVDETRTHGRDFRRMYDLKLVRERLPMFALTFNLMHEIDETSPLYDLDEEDFVFMILTLSGTDDVLKQPVFGRKVYLPGDFKEDHRFANAVTRDGNEALVLEMDRVHDVERIER